MQYAAIACRTMVETGRTLIDLHCHLLPNIDDGPATLEGSLALARLAADQNISTIACTPHILAGVYGNDGSSIRDAVVRMQNALDDAGIDIDLVVGSDFHIVPDCIERLRSGGALCLNDTRYVLIEMPHSMLPPRADQALFELLAAGYVPILTHPERTAWIERDYPLVRRLALSGVAMQITAGAFTGAFGRSARYWSERMLDDGLVDLVATDAHDARQRPPLLAEAFEIVSRRAGASRATRIFVDVPEAILADRTLPYEVAAAPRHGSRKPAGVLGWARNLLPGARALRPSAHV